MADAWGYAIAVLIGGLLTGGATILATWLQARREREERQKDREEHYKLMLYPDNLQAHQKAFYLLRELNKSVPDSIKDMNEARTAAIDAATCQVEEWWASNRFYLDEQSQERVLEAFSRAEDLVIDWALGNDSSYERDDHQLISWRQDRNEFRKCISATMVALEEGIGMKHIEKPKKERMEGKS